MLLAREPPRGLRRRCGWPRRATARAHGWRCAPLCSALTRRRAATAAGFFALTALLERLGLWRQPLFYRAVLDYAFWAGVDAALANQTTTASSHGSPAELHRGPIDLLLHG